MPIYTYGSMQSNVPLTTATGGGAAGTTGTDATAGISSPTIGRPSDTMMQYPKRVMDIPTMQMNYAEQLAQQAYQKQVQSGYGMGNAPAALQAAMQQRNLARLGYMTQAGETERGLYQDYLQNQLKRYGLDIQAYGAWMSPSKGIDIGGGTRIGGAASVPVRNGGFIGIGQTPAQATQRGSYIGMGSGGMTPITDTRKFSPGPLETVLNAPSYF